MAAITKEQVRRVYALGSAAGILESGNKDDSLHALVNRITGKESVKNLTAAEFRQVERELLSLMQYKNHTQPLKSEGIKARHVAPGMMNMAQQGLAWRMIYRLIELDKNPSSATAGERMTGAIKKILGVDAGIEEPFAWISFDQGRQLIEALKRYVRSAEAREGKRGSG